MSRVLICPALTISFSCQLLANRLFTPAPNRFLLSLLRKLSSDLQTLYLENVVSRADPPLAPPTPLYPSVSDSASPSVALSHSPPTTSLTVPDYSTPTPVPSVRHSSADRNEETFQDPSSFVDSAPGQHGAAEITGRDEEIDTLLASLAQRGRGIFYCPYGLDCTKGGVGPDGAAVCFWRNSSFRQVSPTVSCK